MVGNDVVDLRDPDSDPKTHPARFDERVFSTAERRMLRESAESRGFEDCPDAARSVGSARLRWRLWAAKEAAFKAARKRDPATVFSPPRFEVEFSGAFAGSVVHRPSCGVAERFELRWWHHDDAVHAVAKHAGASPLAGPARLIHGFRRLHAEEIAGPGTSASGWRPSRAVRNFACERLGQALELPTDALQIRTEGRVPHLWLSERPATADLSLSHHGEWMAFACWIDVAEHRSALAARALPEGRSCLS